MWIRLDDNFSDDPRILLAGVAPAGLLVLCLSYANRNRTDGWIPCGWVDRLLAGVKDQDDVLAKAVDAQLLQPQDREGVPGFQMHPTYVGLQPSRSDMEELRKLKAKAGEAGGKKSGEIRKERSKLKQTRSTTKAPTEDPASQVLDVSFESREANARSKTNPRSRIPIPFPIPIRRERTPAARPREHPAQRNDRTPHTPNSARSSRRCAARVLRARTATLT